MQQDTIKVAASILESLPGTCAPGVLTLGWSLGKLHLRTRLLLDQGGVILDKPVGQGAESWLEKAIEGGAALVINLKAGSTNYRFSSRLGRVEGDTAKLRLLDRGPVEEVQRRQVYRVPVPASEAVARVIRAAKIPSYAAMRDRPSRAAEFEVKLVDLSSMGMGLICPPKGKERLSLAVDSRLRIVLEQQNEELLLGGCVKHVAMLAGEMLRVGVEFRQAEYDLRDRQNLAALNPILSQLQRAEARQVRGTDVPAAA